MTETTRNTDIYDVDCGQGPEDVAILETLNSFSHPIPLTERQFRDFLGAHFAGLMVSSASSLRADFK